MVTVNMHEAKTQLSRLVEKAESGETIIIARSGRPVAELRALPRVDIQIGGLAARIRFDDEDWEAGDAEVAALFEPGSGLDGAR